MPVPTLGQLGPVGLPLWPHQQTAVEKTCTMLAESPQTVIVMACGTGKTVTAGTVVQRAVDPEAGRVLVAVPTLDLIVQTLGQWRQAFGADALGEVIAVCSDSRRLDGFNQGGSRARVVGNARDLAGLRPAGRRLTVACTYQSLHTVIAAHRAGAGAWDLVVIDELHRADGNSWAQIHDDNFVPAARRVSLTATLKDLAGDGGILVRRDRHGPIAYNLSLGEAIQQDLLADYELIVASAVGPVATELVQREAFLELGPMHVEASVVAKAIAVLRAATEHGATRMITYHSTVAAARAFANVIRHAMEYLPPGQRPSSLWTGHVNGSQDRAVRQQILDQFRTNTGGLSVLTNSRLLIEGYDAPETDAVAIVDPRSSKIEIAQIAGRALRRGDPTRPKTAAIIVPAIAAEDTGQGAGGGFDTVLLTVQAMAALDDRLARHLTRLRRARRDNARPSEPAALPKWISFSGAEIPDGFIDAVATQVVFSTGSRRERHLEDLRVFHAANGHLRVGRDWTGPSGERTGQWLHNARHRHRTGSLPAAVARRLTDLGVVWHSRDAAWEQFIQDLADYKAANGDLLVPATYVTPRRRAASRSPGPRQTRPLRSAQRRSARRADRPRLRHQCRRRPIPGEHQVVEGLRGGERPPPRR
ncbi:DEAD/DEAH box helicase [Kitasatospora brasiliensis]|uniref:DEAD/DEAH box helicase n=1 Tax=Kitasatospora brasiliensis TaxID=3058040 RepID=UPI002930C0EA|nr:DEAD/DEAH box helicase family protein [Kitasatospora sp. K002]